MNKQIVEKQYYAIKVRLESPLSLSSGEDRNTDSDVLRNGSGELFIPGTSLAGAFREALGLEEKENGIMGYSDGEKGNMSSVYISDVYLSSDTVVSERDGVLLTDEKTVDNKFDMEIVETGAEGILYMMCQVREGQNPQDFEIAMKHLLHKLLGGTIRIGSKKTRGFGHLGLVREYEKDRDTRQKQARSYVYRKIFSKNYHPGYIGFIRDCKDLNKYDRLDLAEWIENEKPEETYIKIIVPLKLKGGISIRRYSTVPGEADYEHITCNEKPVIPGSSWAGAIRADVISILNDVGYTKAQDLMRLWFGYANNSSKNRSDSGLQSLIVIEESVIEDAVQMPVTRNRINRFDASVLEGALYQELSYFGGHTNLVIQVKKDETREYRALLGILKIVIQDIQNGHVAVGGLTAVGRGVFEQDGEVNVQSSDKELYRVVIGSNLGGRP